MATLLVALGGLALALLGAAAVDPREAGLRKLLAIGAIAMTLGLAGLPAQAETPDPAAGVRPAASYTAPAANRDSAPTTDSASRTGAQKCWYVLDVLLCD